MAKGVKAVDFLLHAMLVVPQASKWTKMMPTLIFLLSCDVGALLERALVEASMAFKYPLEVARDDNGAEQAEVSWEKLAGKRLHRAIRFLGCPRQRFQVAALCIVIEPLRIMHSRYMTIANKKSSSNRPALLDEVDPSRSMTIKVLQYYSSLLAGQCSTLRLVWGWQQCSDLLAWMRQCPEWARVLRRLILSAACLVLRRFEKCTSKFPWRLYAWPTPGWARASSPRLSTSSLHPPLAANRLGWPEICSRMALRGRTWSLNRRGFFVRHGGGGVFVH